MPHRIEIGLKKGIRDALAEKVKRRIKNDLGLSVESARTLSVFTLDMAWFLEMNSSMSSVSMERPSSRPISMISKRPGKKP